MPLGCEPIENVRLGGSSLPGSRKQQASVNRRAEMLPGINAVERGAGDSAVILPSEAQELSRSAGFAQHRYRGRTPSQRFHQTDEHPLGNVEVGLAGAGFNATEALEVFL